MAKADAYELATIGRCATTRQATPFRRFFRRGEITAGLFTSAYTIRKDADVRRIQNLFALTKDHREIWSLVLGRPELGRVLSESPDLDKTPITEAERFFVLFLILHLASSFEARKHGMYFVENGLREDVANFLSLPIPVAVWEEMSIGVLPSAIQPRLTRRWYRQRKSGW